MLTIQIILSKNGKKIISNDQYKKNQVKFKFIHTTHNINCNNYINDNLISPDYYYGPGSTPRKKRIYFQSSFVIQQEKLPKNKSKKEYQIIIYNNETLDLSIERFINNLILKTNNQIVRNTTENFQIFKKQIFKILTKQINMRDQNFNEIKNKILNIYNYNNNNNANITNSKKKKMLKIMLGAGPPNSNSSNELNSNWNIRTDLNTLDILDPLSFSKLLKINNNNNISYVKYALIDRMVAEHVYVYYPILYIYLN